MPRRVKKTNSTKKIIVIGVAAALIGSVLAVVYRPPATEPKSDDEGRAFLCGSGIANSNQYIQEFLIPSECSEPVGITIDRHGVVWFAESAARKIGKFDPSTQKFEEFPLPDSTRQEKILPVASIWDMKFDKEGNLWFPDVVTNAIWKFNPSKESFEVYRIPSTSREFNTSYPINFDFDSNGNIWFSEIYGKKIGLLDITKAKHNTSEGIREFSPAIDLETLGPLLIDNDGNIWFTALTYPISGKLVKFDPVEEDFVLFNIPKGITSPVGITTDSNGNLWINDHGTSTFIKFNPETNSTINYVTSLPRPSTSLGLYEKCLEQGGSESTCGGALISLPYWNTIDSDGRVWFNLHQGNAIAVFDPKMETLVEYFIPTQNPKWGSCDGYDEPCGISSPLQFALGSDGKIWFTEWSENKIGVLNPNLPLPVKLDITNDDVRLSHGESASIEIKVTTNEKLDSDVYMRISGTIVPAGRIFNMTADFSEQKLTFKEPSIKTVALTLTPENALPFGEYRITVSAQYNDVTYSKILRLTVVPSKV
ncbi:MAG: hypothetical protein QXU32_08875 [Nitrososphaerales archaeon]